VVLLSITIYASTLVAKTKGDPSSVFSLGYSRNQDMLMEKSLFVSFDIEDSNIKNKIYEDLKNTSNFPYKDFNSKYTQIKFNLENYGKR